ncbi:phosphopantetheine-binding protein [Pseudomonadales bacterium]|nr:phosphopantetheine-binding protein [Pseudomonadales bacterium]
MNTISMSGFDKLVSQLILGNLTTDIDMIESDTLLSELNIDSLERLSIAVNLEESCDLELPDKEIDEMESVGDIVECLERASILKQKKRLSKHLSRARLSVGLAVQSREISGASLKIV